MLHLCLFYSLHEILGRLCICTIVVYDFSYFNCRLLYCLITSVTNLIRWQLWELLTNYAPQNCLDKKVMWSVWDRDVSSLKPICKLYNIHVYYINLLRNSDFIKLVRHQERVVTSALALLRSCFLTPSQKVRFFLLTEHSSIFRAHNIALNGTLQSSYVATFFFE